MSDLFPKVNLRNLSSVDASRVVNGTAGVVDLDESLADSTDSDLTPVRDVIVADTVAGRRRTVSDIVGAAIDDKMDHGVVGQRDGQFSHVGFSSRAELIAAGWDPEGSDVQVVRGQLIVCARQVTVCCEPSQVQEGVRGNLNVVVTDHTENGLATRVVFESAEAV